MYAGVWPAVQRHACANRPLSFMSEHLQTYHLGLTITEPRTAHFRIATDCLLGAMVLYLGCILVEEFWEVYLFIVVAGRENYNLS